MGTKNENNLRAAPTIADLVTVNKRLIEEEISSKTIEQFIELLTVHKKHERYVHLLTALCTCGNEAIMQKQNDIIEHLLDNEKNRNILILPIRGHPPLGVPDKLEVLCNEVWHDVREFRHFSFENDRGRLYHYYIALADLAAALCFSRNYRAIAHFEEVYPYEVVYSIIGDP